jgi:hypothetical protein
MGSEIELSIIIVNYQSAEYLKKCAASIFDRVKNINFEVIVVNNSAEEIADMPDFRIINAKENLGFGKGHNLGVKNARGEILWFLNPDTEIITDNIREVLKEFQKVESIGVIGPRLIDEAGEIQTWSAGTYPSIWDLVKNNLGFPASRRIWRSAEKKEADWVSGTALFIKKYLFQKLGGFDEKFFMYFEDIDLGKRVRKAGYKVIYFPVFKIRHFGGKSFKDNKLQKKYYHASQEYYFEKHFGKLKSSLVKLLSKLFYSNKKAGF